MSPADDETEPAEATAAEEPADDPNAIVEHVVKGEDGQLAQKFSTQGGDVVGEYLTYEGGKLATRAFYERGELTGAFEVYGPEGKMTTQMHYVGGLLEGVTTIRDDAGELIQKLDYRKGQMDGTVTVYDNGLVQSRTSYVKDKKNGPFVMFGPQGKPQVESVYKNGELEGLMRIYDEEGHLVMDIPYVRGKRQGVQVEYNILNGGIRSKTTFKGDKKHGDFLEFHEDGSVRKKLVFEDGKPVGEPIEFDTKGRRIPKKDEHAGHKH